VGNVKYPGTIQIAISVTKKIKADKIRGKVATVEFRNFCFLIPSPKRSKSTRPYFCLLCHETWSVVLREERRLRVFDSGAEVISDRSNRRVGKVA
jgi:hypothetical protein